VKARERARVPTASTTSDLAPQLAAERRASRSKDCGGRARQDRADRRATGACRMSESSPPQRCVLGNATTTHQRRFRAARRGASSAASSLKGGVAAGGGEPIEIVGALRPHTIPRAFRTQGREPACHAGTLRRRALDALEGARMRAEKSTRGDDSGLIADLVEVPEPRRWRWGFARPRTHERYAVSREEGADE